MLLVSSMRRLTSRAAVGNIIHKSRVCPKPSCWETRHLLDRDLAIGMPRYYTTSRIALQQRDSSRPMTERSAVSYMANVDAASSTKFLTVTWGDGETSRYPKIFLLDNCKCPECLDPSSLQKSADHFRGGPPDVMLARAELSSDGDELHCTWSNGHRSVYPSTWLHGRRMPDTSPKVTVERTVENLTHRDLVCWDRDALQDRIPMFDYDHVMNDDRYFFDYLWSLYRYGVAIIENSPAEQATIEKMTSRMGHARRTHYGDYFEVKTKPDPSNLAYTSLPLAPHADLPFLATLPGLQLLHCIEQSSSPEEGISLFVDAFNVSKKFFEESPEDFETLCKTKVSVRDKGSDAFGDFCFQLCRPLISLNENGRMQDIIVNNHVRDDYFEDTMTPDDVANFYDVYAKWYGMLNCPTNAIGHQLRPGDMALFVNTRVLHARTGISSLASRHLRGSYYDRDLMFSNLRVLRERLGLDTPRFPRDSSDFF